MNETEFQALFDSYQQALRNNQANPVPQKLHLMIYHYAQRRHQQSSDVSADFYLHVCNKLRDLLDRYDPRRTPFYQYMASYLNFEFGHFLRRRRLPRSNTALLSLEDLTTRRVELQIQGKKEDLAADELFAALKTPQRIYARLALAFPLCFGELRQLISRKNGADHRRGWEVMRAYREYLRFTEQKRLQFLRERDRLLQVICRSEQNDAENERAAEKRLASARKRFFSMDTRIPIRIVAAVTGDPIATVQRQMKKAVAALRDAHIRREKQHLAGTKKKK